MANFTSHAIMSNILYDRLYKNKKFKVNINRNKLKLFSLGQDLTFTNFSFFHLCHSNDSKKFFIDTIKYINENNLQYNSDVMAYLYGHIAHYVLDVNTHSFILNAINNVNKESFLKPHTILECDMDRYLIKRYGNSDSYLRVENAKGIKDLVNSTYRSIYNCYHANILYSNTIRFIKLINRPILYFYREFNIFNMACNRKKYINNCNFYNYVNRDGYLDSTFDKIINNSIKKTEIMISVVNRYLYKDPKNFYLNLIFDNTPYDAEVPIENKNYGINKVPVYNRMQIK